jgi:GMP synthase-like glutamine amidotransferase
MAAATIQIAILDMYDGSPNIGMQCIKNIIMEWQQSNKVSAEVVVFNTRGNGEIPAPHFDLYIATGGPGSPLDTVQDAWDIQYTQWLDHMLAINKPVFLICHSFQIACRHFNLGTVCLRKSKQVGILPVHTLIHDELFNGLQETFYALESRSYQIIAPNDTKLKEMNAQIMALEKMRPQVPLERAIMAIRFTENMYGVQFHPEAALSDLIVYFNESTTKQSIMDEFGIEKWQRIVDHLDADSPIQTTYAHLIPNFLDKALTNAACN